MGRAQLVIGYRVPGGKEGGTNGHEVLVQLNSEDSRIPWWRASLGVQQYLSCVADASDVFQKTERSVCTMQDII